MISTHALRCVVDDSSPRKGFSCRLDFYPRPPCGGRPEAVASEQCKKQFLSTPSVWRATAATNATITAGVQFLSTPSVWRATRWARCFPVPSFISIHALRVEGDRAAIVFVVLVLISIHALRVEGDRRWRSPAGQKRRFLSTPSVWRATVKAQRYGQARLKFLSTPSVWRATLLALEHGVVLNISIHALRVEGDQERPLRYGRTGYFYPRPPCGGRLTEPVLLRRENYFYPRPPCGGRRLNLPSRPIERKISIHALRVEGDPGMYGQNK